jgi:hypothetical protein
MMSWKQDCHDCWWGWEEDSTWHLVGRGNDAKQHPTRHIHLPQKTTWSKVTIVPRLKTLPNPRMAKTLKLIVCSR